MMIYSIITVNLAGVSDLHAAFVVVDVVHSCLLPGQFSLTRSMIKGIQAMNIQSFCVSMSTLSKVSFLLLKTKLQFEYYLAMISSRINDHTENTLASLLLFMMYLETVKMFALLNMLIVVIWHVI